MRIELFLTFLALVTFGSCLQCWTCEGKCNCRDPVVEQCPARTKCYTVKLLTNGDIVRKGCALSCISINQNDRFCEQCDSDSCNSEQSLISMNGVDECRERPSSFRVPRPIPFQVQKKSDIGGGADNQPTNIGSGSQYNSNLPGIGSGPQYGGPSTGNQYNPGIGIGSGTQYGGIGIGSQYNPNNGEFAQNVPNAPDGNYYPSININEGETHYRGHPSGSYPYNGYNNGEIGTGAVPHYNNAESLFGKVSTILLVLTAFLI